MGKVIGIDLGTTKSSVSVIEGGRAVIIPNEMGERTIPSVVSFTSSKERLIGEEALRQAEANPKRTILSVKRHMGTDWTVNIDNEMFTAQEISAMILRRLRDNASVYLGENVTDAVITVPAHFNDIQRQATKDAGRIAGLNVLRIINEPTSAALAYGLRCSHPQKIMVFDLGGGTFDVSIIEIGDGIIEVLSTSGDDNFGGDDFDNIIVNHLLNVLKKDYKADIRKNASSYQRLLFAAKKAKKELSTEAVAAISLPYLAKAQGKFIHFEYELTRAEFEALADDLLDRIAGPVERALNDAGLAPSELGEVLLVGGSTRIPAVIKRVQQLTGINPSRSINSDECVAKGAAIEGDILSNKELYSSKEASILLLDVTPMSLSIETVGGVSTRLVERNTTLPVKYSHVFTTAAQYQSEVEIHVLQGERPMAKDNKTIGRFKLTGIERTMQKAPRLEVTFDIDVNGILTVSASDLDTKKELSIFISANDKMSEDEIRQAVLNSESYVKEDKLRKEASDVKNYANRVLERTGEALSNVGRVIEREEKNKIKDACQTLRRLINRFDSKNMTESQMREIKNAIRDLEFVSADICWKSSMASRDSK